MSYQPIDQSEWRDFLDSFAREHFGWLVTIQSLSSEQLPENDETLPPGDVLAWQAPLEDVRESARENGMDVLLTVGRGRAETSILIENVNRLYEHKLDSAEKGMRIDSGNGVTTLVEFRNPVVPETVDGLAATEQ